MKTQATLEQKKQLSKNLDALIRQTVIDKDSYSANVFLKRKKALDREIELEQTLKRELNRR